MAATDAQRKRLMAILAEIPVAEGIEGLPDEAGARIAGDLIDILSEIGEDPILESVVTNAWIGRNDRSIGTLVSVSANVMRAMRS